MAPSEDGHLPRPVLRCDIHTHILPAKLANRIRAYFEASGMVRCCPSPEAALAPPGSRKDDVPSARELAYPIDSVQMLAQLFAELLSPEPVSRPSALATRRALLRASRMGVYSPARPLHLVSLPYTHQADISLQLNRDVARLAQTLSRDELWNNRLLITPGFTVHPGDQAPLGPADVVREALGRGGRVMKLHCSVGRLSVLDDRLRPVWELAEETGFPTVVHFGVDVMGTTERTDLDDLGGLSEHFPKAKVIVAHFGHPAVEDALKYSSHPSVFYDLTPVVVDHVYLPDPGSKSARTVLALMEAGRILFGSDAPNVAIPASESITRIQRWVHAAARHEGGDDWGGRAARAMEEILGGAAERLLAAVDARRYWRLPEPGEDQDEEDVGERAPPLRSVL